MHAAAEFASWYPDYNYAHQTMVVLEVKSEWKMEEWRKKLIDQDKRFKVFHEPDIGNELTAIACLDDGEIFKRLRLG